MQELSEFHLLILVVIGHVVVADQVGDPGDGHRGLEFIRLGDEPVGQLAAVAHAFDSHTLAVDPQVTADRCAHSIQNILPFVSVLIAENGVGELLPVAGGATIVNVQRGPAMRRVDLILKIEHRTILPVRPAVNIDDERMLRCRRHSQRLGEESLDFELVVVADESERLDFGNLFSHEEFRVQVRELA